MAEAVVPGEFQRQEWVCQHDVKDEAQLPGAVGSWGGHWGRGQGAQTENIQGASGAGWM